MTGPRTKRPDTDRRISAAALPSGTVIGIVLVAILTIAGSIGGALIVSGARDAGPAPEPGAAEPAAGDAAQEGGAEAAAPRTAERVAADPTATGTPVGARAAQTVDLELTTVEMEGQLADGTAYTYWTFDRQVPGPMLRVREGDTVNLTLHNDASSTNIHSIDLHAVNGPGGGATALQVPPGESQSVTFKALNPGVYVYHCATPHIPSHIANGMYGLIVVEPAGGLAPVDEEFYVMQGEIYTAEEHGAPGLGSFDSEAMTAEDPSYVVFNGQANALTGDHVMQAETGDRVRVFVGNGGPNLISSFHVIGEIFDVVHDQGASEASTNVQTTLVPAGGAAWVEFTADVPGDYLFVDHAISRTIDKGALAILSVTGDEDPTVFDAPEAADEPAEEPDAGEAAAEAGAAGDVVEVSMTEFAFSPSELTLPAGEHTFRIVNDGAAPHQFAVGAPGEHGEHAIDTGELAAGESTEVTVTLEPGTYEIGCHVPGHFEAGMKGTLTVTG